MNESQRDYYLNLLGVQRWVVRTAAVQNSTTAAVKIASQVENQPAPQAGSQSAQDQPTEQLDWSALRAKVAGCQACPLHAGRKNTVFGVGSEQADLLIVGEAPGYHEDQQAEPFVGRAGQLLNAMLKAIGLRREQVYISNVLKCRPPNNRDPQAEEVAQCTSFLQRQVQLLQPSLILAVGRHAAHYLLNTNQSLAMLRGRVHTCTLGGSRLVVTYHPAYLLRNPRDKIKAYADLQMTYKLLQDVALPIS
ncbi:MAG: uracil-DNA glycosylase [Gammaproteobacteria bacterium]